MAKDAKGHGSDGKGHVKMMLPGHPYHAKSNDELRFIAKDAREAGKNAHEMGDARGMNKYADQVADASTIMAYRDRSGTGPINNATAAAALSSGTSKSAAVPTHDGTVGRHGYNPSAVNEAIGAQNRSGRGRIGGREAKAIHSLLRGRG